MKCIHCGYKHTEVRNSRPVKGLIAVWRRRHCASCEQIFTTTETAFADNIFVVKSNKRRQRFIYEKLLISLYSVLITKKGADNGENALLARKITRVIIEKILVNKNLVKNLPTSTIICYAYKELKNIHQMYADHYIYYSQYRREVGVKNGFIR